ncbi:MAG: hypothetical protein KDD94_12480 [Calditrichaeota bacterium]|nr:hypothetical protein [Calditrichota bacterium]
MDLQLILNTYIRHLELNNFPATIVSRRSFTYQRFINSYDELNSESLINFYNDNNFLRPHSQCLLQLDLLSWLRFMEIEKLIDHRLFMNLDRLFEEVM